MTELTALNLSPVFLGKEIYVSREVRDVPTSTRFGQTLPGYREYAASSETQPAFVIRVKKLKNAPKPANRQKVQLVNPALTYITERNANRRAVDIPIVIAEALNFAEGGGGK